MVSKKGTVNTKDEQGNDLVLDVRYPSGKVAQDAQLIYTTHWQQLVEGDEDANPPRKPVKVRRQIDEMLREKGIWTDKEENERERLSKKIIELGKKLSDPKIKKTKKEGRDLAVDILRTRNKLRELLQERSSLDANSAEALAENVRFDYLVSVCTVYNKDGEPYFKDYEDYVSRRDEKASWDVAAKLAAMLYGGVDFSENFQDNLIEVQFLKKFGFADNKGNFINKEGKKIDVDGEEITETPEGTDIYGNKIVDGKSQFVFGGFEDDDEVLPVLKEPDTEEE